MKVRLSREGRAGKIKAGPVVWQGLFWRCALLRLQRYGSSAEAVNRKG